MEKGDLEEFEEKMSGQKKRHNKIISKVLIFVGVVIIALIVWAVFSYYNSSFKYNGVEFQKVDEIAPYRTGLPVTYAGGITGAITQNTYYFYLRKDPRTLEYVPLEGEIVLKKNMVIEGTNDLNCNGDGIIAIANLANLYNVLGTKVIKDPDAGCDEEGRYMHLELLKGNETKIEKTGPACYILSVNNCEILEVTEKFMVETLAKVNNLTKG